MANQNTSKLSGPLVTADVKRMVSILAHDAGISIEAYLGRLVTEAVVPKWAIFQERVAAEVRREERHTHNGESTAE